MGIDLKNSSLKLMFKNLDDISKGIIRELINSQDLCKVLYYDTMDALEKDDLSIADRADLIQYNSGKFRIKPIPFNAGQVIDSERTEIRVHTHRIQPRSNGEAILMIAFEILTHNDLWMIDDGKQRPHIIIQELVRLLHESEDFKTINSLSVIGNDINKIYWNDNYVGYRVIFQAQIT